MAEQWSEGHDTQLNEMAYVCVCVCVCFLLTHMHEHTFGNWWVRGSSESLNCKMDWDSVFLLLHPSQLSARVDQLR